jgi:hypothetical protein
VYDSLNTAIPVALLLVTLLLSGCEAPETPVKNEPAPTARETITPGVAPAPAPSPAPKPAPKPETQPLQDDVQPPVEQHTAWPLKLTIDYDSRSGQRPRTFGTAPQPDWLDTGPAGSGAADKTLPDLFDTQPDRKAVSVKGKVLTDGGSEGSSTSIEGAGVNIQIQTD